MWLRFRSPQSGLAANVLRTSEPPHELGSDIGHHTQDDVICGLLRQLVRPSCRFFGLARCLRGPSRDILHKPLKDRMVPHRSEVPKVSTMAKVSAARHQRHEAIELIAVCSCAMS